MRESEHVSQKNFLVQFRECRDSVAAGKPLPLLPARPDRPPRSCAQQFFRGLPEAAWSAALNAKLLQLAQTKVAMYDAYISEMEQFPGDEAYLQQHRQSFGSRPIRVLTSGNHGVHSLRTLSPEELEYEHQVALAQAKWLQLSSNAKLVIADHSSEYIQFDQPDVVTEAIREVVSQRVAHRAHAQRATEFRDCSNCPEMVVIPAGKFSMGSSASEKSWAASHGASMGSVADEAPQHDVSLRSFALGKYDVTRGEYAAFVRETSHPAGDGCNESSMPKSIKRAAASWQNPGFRQTDRDPVVCVSWDDARAYVSWLNGKVRRQVTTPGDGPYRLPGESEWEYAARAGTTTRFWWGDDDNVSGEYAWFEGNSGGRTHPVGTKRANHFGLYDMAGNVWQWTEDCYAESYANAPADGRAAEDGSSCLRVDRGSSWLYPAWLLRPATRERNPAGYRDIIMGFRVAKTIPTQ